MQDALFGAGAGAALLVIIQLIIKRIVPEAKDPVEGFDILVKNLQEEIRGLRDENRKLREEIARLSSEVERLHTRMSTVIFTGVGQGETS